MIWHWFGRDRPWLADGVGACVVLSILVANAAHRPGAAGVPVALALLQGLPLVVRRRWPVPVLAVVLAAWLGFYLYDGMTNPAALLLALFTVGTHEARRTSAAAALATVAIAAVPLLHESDDHPGPFVFKLATFAAAWIL